MEEGDRVIYTSNNHSENLCNPLWGGEYGYIVGTIRSITKNSIYVNWDNGKYNVYGPEDLEIYTDSNKSVKQRTVEEITTLFN